MSKQKTLANREQYVVKANDLIRKTRYNLTTQQQKIVLYAISKIKPEDDINTEYIFDINELANACGMRIRDGGTYYERIKADLRELMKRELQMMPDGREISISWIGDIEMWEKNATVKISFNRNLRPFLFDLKERYTQYKLKNVLAFRGKYAIRLYEILRSYTTQRAIDQEDEKEIDLTLEELKYKLDIDGYERWADLNNYVLKPAISEINELAEDIRIEYYPMRGEHERTIRKINFVIIPKREIQQYMASQKRREKFNGAKQKRKTPTAKSKRNVKPGGGDVDK